MWFAFLLHYLHAKSRDLKSQRIPILRSSYYVYVSVNYLNIQQKPKQKQQQPQQQNNCNGNVWQQAKQQ